MMADLKPCWECLKRRLSCDFGRPGCRKCQRRDTECPGYDRKPLKWLTPGQTRSKGRRAKNESNIIRLTLTDTSEASTVMEAIKYYNSHICPDLEAIGPSNTPSSSFVVQIASISDLPGSIRHTVVSVALAHRMLQFEPGFESDRAILSARLQTHRGGAIRQLSREIKPQSPINGVTLAALISFLFAEVQQCFSPNWEHHCEAAHAIIDLMGGMPALILSQPLVRHLLRYFILIDVIGSTTSPVVEPKKAYRQLTLVSSLPALYGDHLCPSLPCPPKLLEYIIFINHLRSQTTEIESLGNERQTLVLKLLNCVLSFSAEDWVSTVGHEPQVRDSDLRSNQYVIESKDWKIIAGVYQSAVALYCISSLFDRSIQLRLDEEALGQAGDGFDLATLRLAHRDMLLTSLKAISSLPHTQLRKLVLWPLVIAGIELDATDNASKIFIQSELGWISRSLGTASPLIAKEYLMKLWASSQHFGRVGRSDWKSLFDRPYVFAM